MNVRTRTVLGGERLFNRHAFTAATFARDRHRCVLCGQAAVDAHHILDRKLFLDGGYYLSNGSSLCSPCHLEAEKTVATVEQIRATCAITAPAIPEGFSAERSYDKWGNEILADGRRVPGPMFWDDGCRKILQKAGILYSGIFIA